MKSISWHHELCKPGTETACDLVLEFGIDICEPTHVVNTFVIHDDNSVDRLVATARTKAAVFEVAFIQLIAHLTDIPKVS